MLPNYLVQETTIRETGESAVFELGETSPQNLVFTLGITHAMEQESIDVDIYGSGDGRDWPANPLLSFRQKFFCGTYKLDLPGSGARFLKAVWRVDRWGRSATRPLFRFYLSVEATRVIDSTFRATAGSAAC